MGRSVLFFIRRGERRGGEHRVVRHALFREAAVREPVHKRADAREDRNAEEHTQHAAEAAADGSVRVELIENALEYNW